MRSEALAHWYFRLNGFMTIPNFILHPAHRGSQRTDIDILGVRFPHRREFETSPGEIDDEEFAKSGSRPYFLLAEVKSSWVGPNASWLDEARQNVEDVLRAIGTFDVEESREAAKSIRERGNYGNGSLYCSLFLIGDELTESASGFRSVPHRTWNDVLAFVYNRFSKYDKLKTQTDQWDDAGRALMSLANQRPLEEFTFAARHHFRLPAL